MENGDTLWWDAILREMTNVRLVFEMFGGNKGGIPPGCQEVKYHMIFDIKMVETFNRKARMVTGGYETEIPAVLTYLPVVSRDSMNIVMTIVALNGFKILSCDIQNIFLIAKNREHIWTRAGPEFGADERGIMDIVRVLYGLRSSGAVFRALLAEVLHDLGYTPTNADPDVYLRPTVESNGFKYYKHVLCYVDDVLWISENPMVTIQGIQKIFKLKDDKIEPPEMYLGVGLTKVNNETNHEYLAMPSDSYYKAAVTNIEEASKKKSLRLPSK